MVDKDVGEACGQARGCRPENLATVLYNQGKTPARPEGQFSCPCVVKPGLSWSNRDEQKGGNIY